MTWQYDPVLIIDDTYKFTGPYYVTANASVGLEQQDIQSAILKVLAEVEVHGGLDRLQKLTHEISGKVIWIVDNLSEEQKEQVLQESEDPQKYFNDWGGTTLMFPEDY